MKRTNFYVVKSRALPFTNFSFPHEVLVSGVSGRVAVSSHHFHILVCFGLSILHTVNLLSVNCDGVEILIENGFSFYIFSNILTFPDTSFCSITILYHLFNSKGQEKRFSPSLTRLANFKDLVLFLTLMLGIL